MVLYIYLVSLIGNYTKCTRQVNKVDDDDDGDDDDYHYYNYYPFI